jgi:3-oxoacyl-[acyl-carrier protein] reductase
MILAGKKAVVTGADRGIGKAIAIELAKNGADVVLGYRSKEEAAKEVEKNIVEMGFNAKAIYVDVSDSNSISNFISSANDFLERVDVFVNNAGITKDNLLARMSEDEWDSVLNINLKSVFLTTKATAKIMTKQKSGSIIQIASIVGETGNIGQANYTASKAGVIGFTKTAALEVARKNVRVNAIAPGFIETEMTKVLGEEQKKKLMDKIPLKRNGKPEDVANAVVFLASDLSLYITGQVINVDGGMVMQG